MKGRDRRGTINEGQAGLRVAKANLGDDVEMELVQRRDGMKT